MQKKETQNILLVTDLSPQSTLAAREAAARAKKQGARLILLHSFVPVFLKEDKLPETKETDDQEEPKTPPQEHEAQKKLDELANQLHVEFQISVTRILKPNLSETEITSLAQQLNAGLQRAKNMAPEAIITTKVPETNYPQTES